MLGAITQQPSFSIGGESSGVYRIRDLVMDDTGTIYALGREDQFIYKVDPKGRVLKRFGGKGQGPGEFMATDEVLWANGMLWVTDAETGVLHLFKDDAFERSIRVEGLPYSICLLGEYVCVAPMSLFGTFSLLDQQGDLVKTFQFDPYMVEVPNKKMASLWATFRMTPVSEDQLFLGYLYLPLTMTVGMDGSVNQHWSMENYYFEHVIDSSRGKMPGFFSAISFTTGPENFVWVAACREEGKDCDVIYVVDALGRKVMSRTEVGFNLRRIRYLPKHQTLVLIDEEYEAHLFSQHN